MEGSGQSGASSARSLTGTSASEDSRDDPSESATRDASVDAGPSFSLDETSDAELRNTEAGEVCRYCLEGTDRAHTPFSVHPAENPCGLHSEQWSLSRRGRLNSLITHFQSLKSPLF
jgi:hypothetical protein